MAEFNNIRSFKSGNMFLNLREGANDEIIFNIHENGAPVSYSISLSRMQAVILKEILIKKYGTEPSP